MKSVTLHAKMADFYTYQLKDTLNLDGLIKIQPTIQKPAVLKIQRSEVVHPDISRIDSIEKKREEIAAQLKKPTMAQIRYWLRKQEESLLVGTSRTMIPLSGIELKADAYTTAKDIVLPVRNFERINYDWLTIIILFALFLFATVRRPYAKYLGHLFQSMINFSTATRMYREKSYSLLHGAYRLEVYFYLVMSIFVFQAIHFYNGHLTMKDFYLYLICFSGVLGYYIFKRIIYMMVGNVIKGVDDTKEYIYNMNNYNRVLGLFLFPVTAFIMFSPYFNQHFFIVIGLILSIGFYLLSLLRGVKILLKKHFSILYLFLYLCTLEFLPLILIYKLVLE